MVEIKIDEKKFTINEVAYGTLLDLRDKHTIVDEEGREKLLQGKYTRELLMKIVIDEAGNPVDINDVKQIGMMTAAKLDKEVGKFLKPQEIKNS